MAPTTIRGDGIHVGSATVHTTADKERLQGLWKYTEDATRAGRSSLEVWTIEVGLLNKYLKLFIYNLFSLHFYHFVLILKQNCSFLSNEKWLTL